MNPARSSQYKLPQAAPARAFRPGGSALIIALAFLLLLSAVVLALFTTARSDRQNANAFATGQETLRLADAAINLVQGQIRDATIQPRVGWASQPGMIRSFDTSGTVTAHKLYSSDQMVVPGYGKTEMDAEFDQIKNWNAGATNKSFNALYADLNSPAVVKRTDPGNPSNTIQTPVFPIADPAAIGAVEGFSADTSVAGTTLGTGTNRRLPMPVKWIYVLRDGQMTAPTGGTATKATFSGPGPVPSQSNPIVGRIAFWADDDTCKLNINTASEGTFWDTPKANTYSEIRMGISMPVKNEFQRLANHPAFTSLSPVFASVDSIYTRPTDDVISSTSSLNSIVSNPDSYYSNFVSYYNLTPRIAGSLGNSDKSSKGGAQRTSATGRADRSEAVPNVAWPTFDQPPSGTGEFTSKGAPLTPDTDRLYATEDEILFRPDRNANQNLTASAVSTRTFFLTAHGRAPETTLLGTPRVSLWPRQKSPNDRNIRDRLLDFCATTGNVTYAFQREIAQNGIYLSSPPCDSTSHDASLNINMLNYLRKLSAAHPPGFPASLQAKWGATGVNRVLAQTFDHVRANTNSFYVNFGGAGGVTYRYASTSRDPRQFIPANSDGLTVDRANGPTNSVVPAKLGNDVMGMGRNVIFDELAIVFMASEVVNTYTSNNTTTYKEKCNGIVEPSRFEEKDEPFPLEGNATLGGNLTGQTVTKVAAMLLFDPYLASPSFPGVVPALQIEVKGFGAMQLAGSNFIPGNPALEMRAGSQSSNSADEHNRHSQLTAPFGAFQVFANRPDPAHMSANQNPPPSSNRVKFKKAISNDFDKDAHYPFVSQDIPVSGTSLWFSGGTLDITIKNWKGTETIQTMQVSFDPATIPCPQHLDDKLKFAGGNITSVDLDAVPGDKVWNFEHLGPGDTLNPGKRLIGNKNSNQLQKIAIRPGDVVLGVRVKPDGQTRGDLRLLALNDKIPASWFDTFPGYGTASSQFDGVNPTLPNTNAAVAGRYAFGFRLAGESQSGGDNEEAGYVVQSASSLNFRTSHFASANATLVPGLNMTNNNSPVAAPGLNGATLPGGALGDWASGTGASPDGAFFPVADPGDSNLLFGGYFGVKKPLFVPTGNTWEPNRLVPSAGVLGHILTPNSSGDLQPWQTLLFTRRPAAGSAHPGHGSGSLPPDYVFLDNFWMPVVEPFAISEPVSTAGKVNLNAQMLPFTNIQRNTALHGALKGMRMSAVQDAFASDYKRRKYTDPSAAVIRLHIDTAKTIEGMFTNVFNNGKFYRMPAEVARVDLVPEGVNPSNLDTWWNARRLTSDTLREQPYTALLSRVTTKSNTFTVHYRVQVLRQGGVGTNYAEWDESRGIMGEYRGSTTIERYLDPNAKDIPDYTQVNLNGSYDPIDKFYRWRVVSQKQFAP